MRLKWNIIFGLLLIALGAFFLLNEVFDWRADFGDIIGFFWPVALIILGVYLFRRSWREREIPTGASRCTKIFGDIKIEETNLGPGGIDAELGIGDVHLNFSRTSIPDGEHHIHVRLGIGDIKIIIPQGMSVSTRGSAGIGTVNLFDKTDSGLGVRLFFESEQYREARRKLLINTKVGIGDIALVRSET
jgi:predicted membrane protein